MIGICVYPEAIRGVRLEKKKNKYTVKQTSEVVLFAGDIVQGRIKNRESIIEALNDLREDLHITTKDDVYIGLPNELAKINSITIDDDVRSLNEAIDLVPVLGNKKNFSIDIPYVSENYYLESPEDNTIKRLVKNMSYCVVNTDNLNEYVSVFKETNYPINLIEPMALAEVEYVRYDATEPFAIIDVSNDGVNFIVFSKQYGISVYKMTDVNSKTLVKDVYDENGELLSSNINNIALDKIVERVDIISSQFCKKNALQEGDGVRQVIVINADYDFIADAFAEQRPEIESLVASDMLPLNIAESMGKDVDTEYLDLYYTAMMLAMTKSSKNIAQKSVAAVNFAPKDCIDERRYYKASSVALTALIGATALSSVYMAGTIGMNVKEIYSKPDSNKVTPELEAKYEEAKKEDQKMRDNIAKYNTIAANKSHFAKIMDTIVISKPSSVVLTSVNISAKQGGKRAIVECLSSDSSAPNAFVESLRQNPDMAGAEIINQQTKAGQTAIQISVPLE